MPVLYCIDPKRLLLFGGRGRKPSRRGKKFVRLEFDNLPFLPRGEQPLELSHAGYEVFFTVRVMEL